MSVFNITSVSTGVALSLVKPLPAPEAGKDGTVLDKLNKNTGRSVHATMAYLSQMHLLR